jgi:glycerophosphoryl diester phosphodiesterase
MLRTHFTPLPRAAASPVLRIAHYLIPTQNDTSLAVFRRAAEMGADLIEVSIRITADDRAVVTQDDNLKRLYAIYASVREMSLRQLRSIHPVQAEPILTFEEVAFICTALKLGLYVNLKDFSLAAITLVMNTLDAYQLTDYSIIGSFRPDWLAEIKAFKPALHTAVQFSSTHVNPALLGQSARADYIQPIWDQVAPEPHHLLTGWRRCGRLGWGSSVGKKSARARSPPWRRWAWTPSVPAAPMSSTA